MSKIHGISTKQEMMKLCASFPLNRKWYTMSNIKPRDAKGVKEQVVVSPITVTVGDVLTQECSDSNIGDSFISGNLFV